jgi:probable F420-dependent oxidoreductase
VKFGVWLPAVHPFSTPALLARVADEIETRGIDSVWVGEHVVLFDDYGSKYPYSPDGKLPAAGDAGILEPLSTLTFLAARTTKARLGTAICLLAQRNPVYSAKEVATLDWLSGGRVDLGIGVGWSREEFEAVGVPWQRRGARTDDAVGVLRALWETDPSSYQGEFYSVPSCHLHPKPVQSKLPIHVGGETEAALRRVAKLGQGWFTFNRLPEEMAEPLALLDKLLAEQGRTRDEIEINVCSYFHELTPERLEQYKDAGADQVVGMIFPMAADSVPESFDVLEPVRARAAAL